MTIYAYASTEESPYGAVSNKGMTMTDESTTTLPAADVIEERIMSVVPVVSFARFMGEKFAHAELNSTGVVFGLASGVKEYSEDNPVISNLCWSKAAEYISAIVDDEGVKEQALALLERSSMATADEQPQVSDK